MCGFAGRFHPQALPDAPGWAGRASALLAHRGPDGGDRFRDATCELVHRRLAIVDLTPAGNQPLANEDGSVWVVFNGEIYNHVALRRPLEARGHTFRSRTDTEVLVHLYEEYGDAFVERLRGIFAFGVYDARRRRLLLARDRFGVKPLFYTRAAPRGQCVFASEIKAITALPSLETRLDRQACFDYLGLGYVPEPATGFAEIHSLPPGATLSVTPTATRLGRFHHTEARPDRRGSDAAIVEAVGTSICEAVRAQSVADVPVAALLSGGIDSSLVVAAHRRAHGADAPPPRTFSVRFPDPRFDETPLARAVARRLGTAHDTIEGYDDRLEPAAMFDLIRHFDQPFADTSLFPTFWVASGVRARGIRCTLSGDGGDEAFGGYSTFWRTHRFTTLMRTPAWLRRAAAHTGTALAAVTRDLGRQLAKAATLADAGASNSAALLAGVASYLTETQKAELMVPEAREGLLPLARLFDGYRPAAADTREELSRRLTEKLFAVSLPSDMLRKVDMMSMRASIEVRVPLLDEDVVSLGLSLPHRLKTDGRTGKLTLRALARRWLPPEVASHPKHGFAIPLDVMLGPAFHDAVRSLLGTPDARTRPLLDAVTVRRWLDAFARRVRGGPHGGAVSREGLYQRVFTLLSLELWLRDQRLTW